MERGNGHRGLFLSLDKLRLDPGLEFLELAFPHVMDHDQEPANRLSSQHHTVAEMAYHLDLFAVPSLL